MRGRWSPAAARADDAAHDAAVARELNALQGRQGGKNFIGCAQVAIEAIALA
jgi:hypothetical protein